MRAILVVAAVAWVTPWARAQGEPPVVGLPGAFETLVNPQCSHCVDEAKRRAGELEPADDVLCWVRGYSDGGAIPFRFFLNRYRVISDSYGVFVLDPEAGFARGFAPSYEFRFHGWHRGILVMRHADGTLFSALSGRAISGPRAGSRLTPVPTVVSNWGWWMGHYPDAVAYQMKPKYQPVDVKEDHPQSLASRVAADTRLKAERRVLGVTVGDEARAFPTDDLMAKGFHAERWGESDVYLLADPAAGAAGAYRGVATPPREFHAPNPDKTGVSPPETSPVGPTRRVTLLATETPGRFRDAETDSTWDVTGRAVHGKLKGHTLEWVDSVAVKWFAWSAEYPATKVVKLGVEKSISGTAEFLRVLPKAFARVDAIDTTANTITLTQEGQAESVTWPVEPDAEVKVQGFWGRLSQLKPGERVWVWHKLDRQKKPVAVVMVADATSERVIRQYGAKQMPTPDELEAWADATATQKSWMRGHWLDAGLPGTLTFHHIFSGELEVMLDHEAMRWGRSLTPGARVTLAGSPSIEAVVKAVTPWRERTQLRLVVGELESADLKPGMRVQIKTPAPVPEVESSVYPPDCDRARTDTERIEWALASTYCTCGVGKDTCTGHFYTLASCNPNGCGMPDARRAEVRKLIQEGKTDREVIDTLLKSAGPQLLVPHLKP